MGQGESFEAMEEYAPIVTNDYLDVPPTDPSGKNFVEILAARTDAALLKKLFKDKILSGPKLQIDAASWTPQLISVLRKAADTGRTEVLIDLRLPGYETNLFGLKGLRSITDAISESDLLNLAEIDNLLEVIVGSVISKYLRAFAAESGFTFVPDHLFDTAAVDSPSTYCVRYPIEDRLLKVYFRWESSPASVLESKQL